MSRLYILAIGVVLILLGGWTSYRVIGDNQVRPGNWLNQQVFKMAASSLKLEPVLGTINAPADKKVAIKFTVQKTPVSSLAVRLFYEYKEAAPKVKVIDSDNSKQGVQIKINEKLVEEGWSFPVNSVKTDVENQRVVIDLAGVFINTDGYTAGESVDFGWIELSKGEVKLEIDEEMTKVLAKELINNQPKNILLNTPEALSLE